jgi:hypothetical protein
VPPGLLVPARAVASGYWKAVGSEQFLINTNLAVPALFLRVVRLFLPKML